MPRAKARAWRCCPGTRDAMSRLGSTSYLTTGGVATTASNPTITVDGSSTITIAMRTGRRQCPAKRVTGHLYASYLFIGPIASWFGGAFTTVPITGVAIMREEMPYLIA